MKRLLVPAVCVVWLMGCPDPSSMDGGTGGGAMGGGSANGGGTGGSGGSAGGGSAGGGSAGGGSAGGGSAGGGGGAGGGNVTGGGAGGSGGGGGTGPILTRPSRSTPVDITRDDSTIAMVNQDSNSLSIFSASQKTRTAQANFGNDTMPVSVVIHPDQTTAFVVLRRSGELARVTSINTVSPLVGAQRALVGSEPTGVALSPTGAIAVVANFNNGTLSFVDTANMTVTGTANVGGNPRALAITNDGDNDDFDERIYVTQFFGDATSEMTDNGRVGKVQVVDINTRAVTATISLNPIADTGFANALPDGGAGTNVGCGINQLFSIVLNNNNNRGYVTSVCAAPAGPVSRFTNVFSAVSVFDMTNNMEDTGLAGSVALSRLVAAQGTSTSNLLGVPIGIDVKPGTNVAYLASQAGDTVQRIHFTGMAAGRGPIILGPDALFAQMSTRGTGGIKVPNGIVVAHTANAAYVANWAERSLSIIDLATQALDTDVNSATLPTPGGPEARALNGLKFFFTGTGRWADRSVNSCGSCHPDGLSDHITWQFAAGPRQSTPLDGSYNKTNGEQRAFNWTAIFDEMHDFELNTRGTAGGKGAITTGTPPGDMPFNLTNGISLDGGANITRNDFLSGSTKAVVASVAAVKDWDEIEDYVKTIKPLKAPRGAVTADVTAGRLLFESNNCAFCHGGPLWSNSRVPYTPSPEKNGSLPGANLIPDAGTGLRTQTKAQTLPAGLQSMQNTDTLKVDVERGVMLFNGSTGNVGPERITCAVRAVGTFDRALAIERKADGTQAQGIKGFNPPSLLSINVGAPFFHHGAARRLEDVFTSPWAPHYQAASANFLVNGGTTQPEMDQIRQLVAFLRSIDETTAPVAIPAAQDICGGY
ncbi:MAG: YncE family protein [Archangium sp.]|nr:YncE family protein [Archangium sp.]